MIIRILLFLLLILNIRVQSQTRVSPKKLKGIVFEDGTKLPIPYSKIYVTNQNGDSYTCLCDSLGEFNLNLENKLAYQVYADSDSLGAPCDKYGIKHKRYFASEKLLIKPNDTLLLNHNFVLKWPQVCILKPGPLFKKSTDSTLSKSDNMRLNGCVEILKSNPTLTFAINNHNCDIALTNMVKQYLVSNGIDSARIENPIHEPFEISCYFEWNNKGDYPELKEGMKITEKTLVTLDPKTQEFLKKYLHYIDFRIVRTDFNPNDEPSQKR